MPMRRFLMFFVSSEYPVGGLDGWEGEFDSVDEIIDYVKENLSVCKDELHILDVNRRRIARVETINKGSIIYGLNLIKPFFDEENYINYKGDIYYEVLDFERN